MTFSVSSSPDLGSVPFLDKLAASSWSRFLLDFEAYTARGGKRSIRELVSSTVLRVIRIREPEVLKMEDADFVLCVSGIFAPASELEAFDRFRKITMESRFLSTDSVLNFILAYEKEEALCAHVLCKLECKPLRKLFISNLRPQRLAERVEFRHPKTLAEAKLFAMEEAELLLKISSEAQLLANSNHGSVVPKTTPRAAFGSEDKSVVSLSVSGSKPFTHSSGDPKKCHGCGHVGHIRPLCPYKDVPGWLRSGERTSKLEVPNKPNSGQAKNVATGPAEATVPRIQVTLRGIDGTICCSALLDTGASANFMSPTVLSAMLPLGVTLRKSSREFTVASGQKVGSLEDVICPMQVKCCATPGLKRDLEIDTTFSVMDTGEELILGFPFLQSSGLLTILSATVSTEAVDETPFDSAFPSEDGWRGFTSRRVPSMRIWWDCATSLPIFSMTCPASPATSFR
eukprot:ANDGO_00367.mRNA.1 hypothetical protein